MAKILILTYGSRGDVQPYVALGQGLQRAGHEVTLATSDRFEQFVTDHGLQYGFMSDDMLAIMDTDTGRDLMENTTNVFAVVGRTLSLMKQVGPMQTKLMQESWEAAERAQPDIILFHPKAYAGPHLAEKLGIPVIMALVIPMMVPTGEHPNMGFPNLPLGRGYNRATYRFVNSMMKLSGGKHVRELRAKIGLPPQKKFDMLQTTDGQPMMVIHGVSKHVDPPPADWPDTSLTTGYWFLDSGEDWTPPPELAAFLEAGPKPVYVGFGSMSGRNPERLTRIVIDALEKAGKRAVMITGWGGLSADHLPDSILKLDQAPHDWLFPRMAAVIHHGGAGTTAGALRAGRPNIIVPFFGDQPFWGKRVQELGVGSAPIPQKKLTADKLARAIVEVTSNAEMQQKAEELGARIRQEDGIGEAVKVIEGML